MLQRMDWFDSKSMVNAGCLHSFKAAVVHCRQLWSVWAQAGKHRRPWMSSPSTSSSRRPMAWHVVAMFAALFAFGGLPAVIWGGALRAVWVYHITWFVNSASHCWGIPAV